MRYMTCAFPGCRMRLNIATDTDGTVTYLHGPLPMHVPDHEPRPVSGEDLEPELVCDFCGVVDPEWSLGAQDFTTKYVTEDGKESSATHSMDAQWAACVECKALLDIGRTTETAKRLFESMRDRGSLDGMLSRQQRRETEREIVKRAKEMHDAFQKFRTYDDWAIADVVDKKRIERAFREATNG